MKDKINVAELLRNCPNGMDLDCTMFENVKFSHIQNDEAYPIVVTILDTDKEVLTAYGTWNDKPNAKCVIYPKGKTSWEGFQRPFKDGDILVYKHKSNNVKYTFIYKRRINMHYLLQYCGWFQNKTYLSEQFNANERIPLYENDDIKFATEEEKAKLFDAIKANGYKWNEETKTLEKLIDPKFKDGDIVSTMNGMWIGIVKKPVNRAYETYITINGESLMYDNPIFCFERFATDKEKAKLFKAIKDNGYKWNEETKTLEKLIEPKFKVGDKVKHKDDKTVITITGIKDNYYLIQFYNSNRNDYQNEKVSFKDQDKYELVPNKVDTNTLDKLIKPKFKVGDRIKHKTHISQGDVITEIKDTHFILNDELALPFIFQDEYVLIPNKFNINTLKPFESRVLVRGSDPLSEWKPAIFGIYRGDKHYSFYVVGGNCWKQCIPYEGNEHLLGTTNDCDEYFKSW